MTELSLEWDSVARSDPGQLVFEPPAMFMPPLVIPTVDS
jgi:hypothetical protein